MSSPRNSGPVREGNRVVLREITATLHNSSPLQTPRRKSGGDNSTSKAGEHEVKVQFAREFADVESITCSAPHTVSSASSVRSLVSTKSGSCYASPVLDSPLNNSYANSNISGLDDLIHGCAGLQLNSDDDRSFDSSQKSVDLSQNQTFASATDEPDFDATLERLDDSVKEILKRDSAIHNSTCSPDNSIKDIEERPASATARVREPLPAVLASPGRRSSFIKLEVKLGHVVENPESPERNNDSRSGKGKTNSSLVFDEDGSSNESLSKKNVDHLEKADAVNLTEQDGRKELIEDISDNRELKISPGDVSLKSEVPGVEQNSESKAEEQNTSLATLDVGQLSLESLKTDIAEQTVNKLDSSIDAEKLHVSLESDALKIDHHSRFKQQERDTSLTTSNIIRSSLGELKTGAIEEVNGLDPIGLEKSHDISLKSEIPGVDKPQERNTTCNTLDIEQASLEELSVNTDQISSKLDTIDLEDVSLKSEVPRVEKSEFKPQERITSWDTLDIKQPSFEELEAAAAEQTANKLDSSLDLEQFHNVTLDAEELEVEFSEFKLEEQNSSLATLGIEQANEELKTVEQVSNKLDSINLEKFHDVSLNAEELTESLGVEEPREELKASESTTNQLNSTVTLSGPQDVSLNAEGVEQYIESKQSTSLTTLDVEQLTSEALKVVERIADRSDSNVALDATQNVSSNSQVTPEVDKELKPQRQSTSLSTLEQPTFEEPKAAGEVTNKLDTTTDLNDYQDALSDFKVAASVERYTEFKPQRQSTSLATLDVVQPDFEELKAAAAEQVANDIFNSSLGLSENTDRFVSATSDIFQDPTTFDFLMNHGNSRDIKLRTESLYIKFDPLISGARMLPQGNTQPIDGEQNDKSESIPADINTPKRNPAIAAIDRLLFYSPLSTSMTQKADETQEKVASKEQPTAEPEANTPTMNDVNMSKELELVRTTVLQLEEELEKRKKEYEAELEKQQEKVNKLQAQVAQEVKSKSQMTVVVEEYEKSISRLLTERERDRTNFEQEKGKLQEEVQSTNVHLANMEVAFSDLHQKYEKLKGVVSAYKNNESVLKESIQENLETIKGLEMRYEQLKNHAMSQLEKANYELDAMRKQHEDETVTLHAMVRKAELKSNSLAELVEQKTKENKELAQILDEVIARVGHQNPE